MTDKIVVMTTCSSSEEAQRIARALVDSRLAACVNVLAGCHSVYRWKGEIETSEECLLLVKSSREMFTALRAKIEAVHSYELPEVIALPILEGSPNYLAWIEAELGGNAAR